MKETEKQIGRILLKMSLSPKMIHGFHTIPIKTNIIIPVTVKQPRSLHRTREDPKLPKQTWEKIDESITTLAFKHATWAKSSDPEDVAVSQDAHSSHLSAWDWILSQLSIQVYANTSGNQQMMPKMLGFLPLMWETHMGFLAPCFGLAQRSRCRHSE